MTLKNIIFGFFITLTLMLVVYFLKQPSAGLSSAVSQDIITTSDDYIVENSLILTDFAFESPAIASQPTPANLIEQKDGPVLRVEKTTSVNLDGFKQIYSGIFYKKSGSIAIIRVDLNNPDVKFFVNPDQPPKTVCSFVRQYGLQLATNGGGFDIGGTGQAVPFAMSEGRVYSRENQSGITLFVTDSNRVIFATDGQIPSGAKYAVTGFNRIVQNGQMLDQFHPGHQGYKAGYGYLKRRTSIGISGSWLNIVLFDSPITVTDEGQFHLDTFPGTEHVYNMDGGGSTNACTADYGSLVTESGRQVANIFGIYSSPIK